MAHIPRNTEYGCIAKRRTTGVGLPGQGSMMHERTGIRQGKGKGETGDEVTEEMCEE